MTDVDAIPGLRERYAHCFGCGPRNPIGLQLTSFEAVTEGVRATFVPRPEYAGFDDTLHGGVVATALDEASAWAALHTHGVLVFTAKLDIRYRSEARVDSRFTVIGRVTERRGRRLLIDATIANAETEDRPVASSSGLFVVAEEHTAALADQENSTTTTRPSAT